MSFNSPIRTAKSEPSLPPKGAIVEGHAVGFDVSGQALVEVGGIEFKVDGRNIAPGDRLTIRILRRRTKEAKTLTILDPSPNRRSPRCRHFGVCGGCSWQHLPYQHQLLALAAMVRRTFLVDDQWPPELPEPSAVIGCPSEWEYRNKLEFTAASRVYQLDPEQPSPVGQALGFFVPFSGNKVLPLEECFLQGGLSEKIRAWTAAFAKTENYQLYDNRNHEGELRTVLVKTTGTGQTLVMMVFAHCEPDRVERFMAALARAFPDCASIYHCHNPKLNDSYADLTPVLYAGQPHLTENLDGLQFRVGPQSFMQVNPAQTVVLYQTILKLAAIQPDDLVWDLYCGAGTISLFAARLAKAVIGIESVAEAVEHARSNATLNGLSNLHFFAGDMRQVLTEALVAEKGEPQVIIVDPPRAGLHPSVAQLLTARRPRTLVYVSCKLTSLKRDLEILQTAYRVEAIQPIDLMPQTTQVETIVLLRPRDLHA